MQNRQAMEMGKRADEIINNLANPQENITTEKADVEVLDKAKEVEHPQEAEKKAEKPTNTVPQDDYETRFKRYKASTDTTIHELRQQIAEAESFKKENDSLRAKLDELKEQVPDTPNEMLEMFSKEEVEAFQKMFEGKVGTLQSQVDILTAELEEARKGKQKEAAMSAHQRVVDAVKSSVPDYDIIDKDPEFAKYMQDLDAFGNVRYDMMIRAKNSTPPDIGRIIQFYVDFADSNKVQEEPTETKQFTQQELLQNPKSNPSPVNKQQTNTGRVWNQAAISEFYKDKATGKIPPKRAAEIEQEIFSALKGRR